MLRWCFDENVGNIATPIDAGIAARLLDFPAGDVQYSPEFEKRPHNREKMARPAPQAHDSGDG